MVTNMRDEYEIIIIGGGPGGLSAAIELAKNKRSVLLLEKNKEIGPKVCAGGLTTKISQFGIGLDIAHHQFSTIKAHTSGKTYDVTLPQPFIATVSRKEFGQLLLQKAVASGAEIRTGSVVKEISPDFVVVNDKKIKYKYLIGADGSLSAVRKFLGLPTKKMTTSFQYLIPRELPDLEIFLDAKMFGAGYAWIFPHQGYTSVGVDQDVKEIRGENLKAICTNWCKKMKISLDNAREESWVINYDHQGWQFNNIFLVGDAGGFTPGLTGEGIYYAMISGQEVAKKIIDPYYSFPQIKRILKKKNNQEKLLHLMQMRAAPLGVYYKILLSLFKYKWATRKIVDFFS